MNPAVQLTPSELFFFLSDLGYHTCLKEEIIYKVDEQHNCVPVTVSTLVIIISSDPL